MRVLGIGPESSRRVATALHHCIVPLALQHCKALSNRKSKILVRRGLHYKNRIASNSCGHTKSAYVLPGWYQNQEVEGSIYTFWVSCGKGL